MDNNKIIRAVLLFFLPLGIGSAIINHTQFKIEGYTSRSGLMFLFDGLTFWLFSKVMAVLHLFYFDPANGKTFGLALKADE